MSASLSKKIKKEVIAIIARKLSESIDGVTKSKEVSKEFYLIATKIQNETEEIQQQIIWTASAFFVEDWYKQYMTEDSKIILHLQTDSLNEAYNDIKGEEHVER